MSSVTMLLPVLLLFFATHSGAVRILGYFPIPSISHQVVFRPLTQELAKRGHEVVIITPDPAFPKDQAPKNIREIDVHDISYGPWKDQFVKKVDGSSDSFNQMQFIFKSMYEVFDKQMNSSEIEALFNDEDEHFDLVLTEAVIRPALSVTLRFKAPVIQVSSFGSMDDALSYFGAPSHLYYYPEMLQKRLFDLSIWDKINELYGKYRFWKIFRDSEKIENKIIRKYFGDNAPGVGDLQKNVDMMFLNLNPIWDNNRPVPPGIVYMGGLHITEKKNLTKDLQEYLDTSKNGVIYISFGTNVDPSFLPPEKIKILTNVFSRLPYDVLWKWNADVLPGQPKNVKISKWFPQSHMLHHPNIKLFITQGGLQSTDEAIAAAVPLIAIPMLGDQWYNAEQYVQNKFGLKLSMETITESIFDNAIHTVLNDTSYRQNIIKFRDIIRDQPETPLERAVWWTEYVIRHGGAKHLKPFSANSSWSEYLALDVVFILTSAFLISLSILGYVLLKLVSFVGNFIVNDKVKVN